MPSTPAASLRLRLAVPADLPALRSLIPRSVRALSQGFYTPQQIESAIQYVFGPDTQLIADNTYFVVETVANTVTANQPAIVGCGGWSRRRALYGGDQMKDPMSPAADALLDPAIDAARIRAFFVEPDRARQGVAARLLAACIDAARSAGFTRLQLVATLPGVPFYARRGFTADEQLDSTLPDGTSIAFVQMSYTLGNAPPAVS